MFLYINSSPFIFLAATRLLTPWSGPFDSEGGRIVSRCRFIFSWFSLHEICIKVCIKNWHNELVTTLVYIFKLHSQMIMVLDPFQPCDVPFCSVRFNFLWSSAICVGFRLHNIQVYMLICTIMQSCSIYDNSVSSQKVRQKVKTEISSKIQSLKLTQQRVLAESLSLRPNVKCRTLLESLK